MRRVAVALCAFVLLAAAPAGAHRLDEYLQAATIAVETGRVQVDIRLAPGVDVFPRVFSEIDGDADGVASLAEQQVYAERVARDLSLSVDERPVTLRLISSAFAPKPLLETGRGEIYMRLEADVPGAAPQRRLTFENRHQKGISSYLVNGLMPRDSNIQLGAQHRNYDQTFYRLDYTDTSAAAGAPAFMSWLQAWGWTDAALLAVIVSLALTARGMHRANADVRASSPRAPQ